MCLPVNPSPGVYLVYLLALGKLRVGNQPSTWQEGAYPLAKSAPNSSGCLCEEEVP